MVGLNKKLAAGELKDLSVMCEDQVIDVRDDVSDESVGWPWKKKAGDLTYCQHQRKSSPCTFIVVYRCISGVMLCSMMTNDVIVLSQKH